MDLLIKKIRFSLLFVLPCLLVSAQQVEMINHYFYNPIVYNPAFTGYAGCTNIMLISHNQWTDFTNHPQLNMLTLDKSFKEKKAAIGLEVISDTKGIINRSGGYLSYSYRLILNDDMYLAFGLSVGVIDQTLDYSKVLVETAADPTIFSGSRHQTNYDANAGLAFVWKGLEFGAAVPQYPGNTISYSDNTDVHAYYIQAQHYMGSLKYRFFISEENGISIAPMGFINYVAGAPLQYDMNLNLDWFNKFWVGATYKSDYAVALNLGFCIRKQFYVGYSYDLITGAIGQYSGPSQEIMLNLKFGRDKKIVPEPIAEEPVVEKAVVEKPVVEKPVVEKKLSDSLLLKPVTEPVLQKTLVEKTPADSLLLKPKEHPVITELPAITEAPKVKEKTQELNSDHLAKKGFYVVVGSFYNRDFAQAEVKRLIKAGFKAADWMYFEPTQFNYVFIEREDTKENANSKKEVLKSAEAAKAKGIPDMWILRIKE